MQNPPVRIDEGEVESAKPRRVSLLCKINPLFAVLSFMTRHWRGLLSLLAIAAGGYLLWSGVNPGTRADALGQWLRENGDADLQRYYEEARDAKERASRGIAFKAYEKRYGKGAWVQHFKQENLGENVAYKDIAELAVGMSTAEERDEFLASHAAAYEACVQNGEIELAFQYGKTLRELRDKGGKEWRVVSHNSFALAMYDALKQKGDLWDWYLDNAEWCDSFLMTCEPELHEDGSLEGAGLAEAAEFVHDHSSALKQFANEISALSVDELKEIADGDRLEESKEALFASSLLFVGKYYNVLEPMLKAASRISMLEAMAVVANNYTAFGLGEENVLDSPNKCRTAAMDFVRIHDERKIIWDFATGERGIDCIAFCEKVGNYEWCEQVIGMFGEAEVVAFLNAYYGDSPMLLRVATETLYRCQEPGWAVLQEYRDNVQVKNLLLRPKIGYRLVPFYLKKGYDGFSQLDGDERWIDELLDKNGNLKRMDVSWYEMLPVGGDVATVVKKWAQGRPVTAGELAWAGVDVLDTAGMAISFGMSKVATTGAKEAGKASGRQIAQRTTRNVAQRMSRDITKKMARKVAKGTALRATKRATKVGARKISFLRKVNKWFRKVPAATFGTGNSVVDITKKPTRNLLGSAWETMKKMDQKAWQNVYKGCKTLMWCRYLGYTVPKKLPDAMHTALESAGEFVGRTLNSLVAGAGDGLKAAVREALGLPKGYRMLNLILGGVLCMLGVFMLLRVGSGRRNALN